MSLNNPRFESAKKNTVNFIGDLLKDSGDKRIEHPELIAQASATLGVENGDRFAVAILPMLTEFERETFFTVLRKMARNIESVLTQAETK